MFSRFKTLFVVLVAVLLLAIPVAAQWSGNWVSSFQVMNLGNETANLAVEYYNEDGTNVGAASHTYTVTQGSSINLYQPNIPGLSDGFKGSAVVSADQPVAAIGSELVTYSDGRIGNSQYSGFGDSEVGTMFYLPNVNKKFGGGQWSSRITVQNTTSGNVDLTIKFYDGVGGVVDTQLVSLAGNGSVTLSQLDNPNLSDGWLGSATVESTGGNVAVVVDVMSADGRVETYNGFASGATTMYLPTLLIDFGGNAWNTSFQVLNVGSAEAVVTMTYYTSGEIAPTKVVTANVGVFNSINRYQPNVDPDLGTPWIGSVVVEATQPIVAVGSQSSSAAGKQLASIYNGVSGGATSGYLPTVLKNFGGSNFITGFQIMNVGGSAAEVTVEYYAPGEATPVKVVHYNGTEEPKIDPFNSVNRYQGHDSELATGWQGSVKVTSDQPVVLLGSQNGLNRSGDAAGQYNGIMVAP